MAAATTGARACPLLVSPNERARHTPRRRAAVWVQTHESWPAFMDAFRAAAGPKRLVAFTVYGSSYYAGGGMAHAGAGFWGRGRGLLGRQHVSPKLQAGLSRQSRPPAHPPPPLPGRPRV
jgi:hypothetical protein